MKLTLTILGLLGMGPIEAGNLGSTTRHAHDANGGWIDFAPPIANAVQVGNYYVTGYAWSANYGWIHFGSGPTNKLAYTMTGSDYGVNSEANTGRLTGRAYAANIGWIDFGWAAFNDPNRASYTPLSGTFSGYAWSSNVGWISLSGLKTTDLAIFDSDGDNIDDPWEITNFGNLTTAGVGTDWDKDGQTDAAEFVSGTNPKDNTSWLKITAYTNASGATSHTITFTCVNTRHYRIWTSTNLAAGSWVIAPTTLDGSNEFIGTGTGTHTKICIQPAAPARFFRVSARKY